MITKALIPCGGKGTRMRALTGGAPKELISVAGVPALERVARECAASGIEDVLIVTAPGKEVLEAEFRGRGGESGMPRRFHFVVQREARGLADAMRLGREFAAGEPLAVALPDNLFLDRQPGLAQVIESFGRHGTSAVAVVEILPAEGGRRGPKAIYVGRLQGDDLHLARISDKGARVSAVDLSGDRSAFTGVGRYVFTAELFPTIEEVERTLPAGAELDDVPVMQRLAARRRLIARRIRGRFFDIGVPDGYREADQVLGARC